LGLAGDSVHQIVSWSWLLSSPIYEKIDRGFEITTGAWRMNIRKGLN